MSRRTTRPRSLLAGLLRCFGPDELSLLIRVLVRATRAMTTPSVPLPELTYHDAIAYFAMERPDDPRIVKGALLLQPQDHAQRVVSLFLDAENAPLSDTRGRLYGRCQLVERLDEELTALFDGTELVILE